MKKAKYTPRSRIVGAAMIAPSKAPNPAAASIIKATLSDRAPSTSVPACEPPEMYDREVGAGADDGDGRE